MQSVARTRPCGSERRARVEQLALPSAKDDLPRGCGRCGGPAALLRTLKLKSRVEQAVARVVVVVGVGFGSPLIGRRTGGLRAALVVDCRRAAREHEGSAGAEHAGAEVDVLPVQEVALIEPPCGLEQACGQCQTGAAEPRPGPARGNGPARTGRAHGPVRQADHRAIRHDMSLGVGQHGRHQRQRLGLHPADEPNEILSGDGRIGVE